MVSNSDVADYTPSVAIVTGAAQGIGRAIALRLADDGFSVAIADVATKKDKLDSVVEEIQAKGRKAITVAADVSLEADVVKLVEETVRELGGLDVMVANAGVARMSSFLEMTTELFDLHMSVNARGVMLCYKYAALQMVKQKRGGRIIGASSVLGKQGGAMLLPAYSASKFAVRGLTHALSQEMIPHKVTVNAYCPGCIITDMVTHPEDSKTGLGTPGSYVKYICGIQPNGPESEPAVVASLVSYLCKPEAHFISGQSLSVCGGFTTD